MPSVPYTPDQRLPATIAGHEMRIRALETQQQAVISNLQGQSVLAVGLSPGSNPPQYGIQLLDPASGAERAFFGEDGSGNIGLTFRDSTGNLICRLDEDGLHVYNPTGTEEVAAGLLNAAPAIYGLGVLPYGGSELQQVGGSLTVLTPTESSVTSDGVWTNFTSPSSLTCEIGPSGQAQISVSAYLGTYGSNEVGAVGVGIDGANSTGNWAELSTAASGGVSGVVGSTLVIDGLTTGPHTFQLQYKTGAHAETFQARMILQPL